jgi:hypothetical protein
MHHCDWVATLVSRPFPSWNRSILTEIYLCHACSCQEILRTETAGQVAAAGGTLNDTALPKQDGLNMWPALRSPTTLTGGPRTEVVRC